MGSYLHIYTGHTAGTEKPLGRNILGIRSWLKIYSHTDGTEKPLGRIILGISAWLHIYTVSLMEQTKH